MGDFSLYSEIFWGAASEPASEASDIFYRLLCDRKKMFGGY